MIVWARNTPEHSHQECRYCHDAIHDGDTCIECWRDLRTLALERDREWWAS